MKKSIIALGIFGFVLSLSIPTAAEEKIAESLVEEETTEPSEQENSTETSDTKAVSGDSIVINNDGEVEELTIDDLISIHSGNQLRWDKNYVGAKVIVTSDVKEIKTDEWLVLETDSYTPKIVLHLGNGWIVSGASSNFVENLNIGDKIQFAGTITGFMKYGDGVAVIYTSGNPTYVQMADESSDGLKDTVVSMINDFLDGRNYAESQYWLDFYKSYVSEDEEGFASLKAALDEALSNCYQGTYLDKYDSMFTCTDVVPCDVENYGEGYDYYDPIYTMDMNVYIQHLKNKGFKSTDNQYATATVNGVQDTYATLANADDVLVALAQGDGYVRVLVWSKEAYNDRKNQAENGVTDTSAENVIYTDPETVTKVQTALNAAGYDCGAADGAKGPHTTEVIRQYQTDNGLNVSGEIDDQLLASLGLS